MIQTLTARWTKTIPIFLDAPILRTERELVFSEQDAHNSIKLLGI
jgi:hypothetical protein